MRKLLSAGLFIILISCQSPEKPIPPVSPDIRINQIGYYPGAPKKIIVATHTEAATFHLVDIDNSATVFEGMLGEPMDWELAGETVRVGDFSDFSTSGTYYIDIDGVGASYPFEIREKVLHEAFLGSVKGLYYQRSSQGIPEIFGGKWHRKMGHPDKNVAFHESTGRQGQKLSDRGWYDAGDFGKYVVNGAFSLGQLMMLYEQYPEAVADNTLNIPESGNGVSDLLDELKYELDWLVTMQDEDGGLFFKLTTKNFEGMIMPHEAEQQRYIIGKSTAASLDFAAVAARAYRVFLPIDELYANECLRAARAAWEWAVAHPDQAFTNPADIATGQYGDKSFDEEFYWAAAELYAATGEEPYLREAVKYNKEVPFRAGAGWNAFMRYMAVFTLIDHLEENMALREALEQQVISMADDLVLKTGSTAYFQPISDFNWGSNSDVANAALVVAQAYRINPRPVYLQTVQEITDYLFGKNATGYSFLTGFGDKTPMFIHHRQSAADGIAEPVPGLLSGGPNSRQQDKAFATYPENVAPMKSWVDQEGSYASNEICLNWNAPLTYVLGFLEMETK
jgi:endoglucanase